MITPRQLVTSVLQAVRDTINHDGIEHAGYLAFIGLLAMFPFLVLIVACIGVLGQGQAGAEFIASVLQNTPRRLTAGLEPRIQEIISGPPQTLLTVSILGAIWTASSAVEGLRTILNRAYRVATPPAYWFRRSLSVLQLIAIAFIVVSGMILVIAIPLFMHHVEDWFHVHFISEHQHYISRMVILTSVGLLWVAVSSIYYFIPNMKQSFLSVAPGSVIVVVAWLGAADLFTIYLSNFDQVNLIYGSLGGVIAALVFFYICNIIFIFGAEFNHQIMATLGMRVEQREEVHPKDLPPSSKDGQFPHPD